MKRVNGGLRVGRTWLGFKRWRRNRYSPKAVTWRAGGQRTPGPWWQLEVPHIGTFIVNRDRTIFGWDDSVNAE